MSSGAMVTADDAVIKELRLRLRAWLKEHTQPIGGIRDTVFTRVEGMNYWSTWVPIWGEEAWGLHLYDDGEIRRIA